MSRDHYSSWIHPASDPFFDTEFTQLPAREAKAFAERWNARVPKVQRALSGGAKATGLDWVASLDPASLDGLGRWIALKAQAICRTLALDFESTGVPDSGEVELAGRFRGTAEGRSIICDASIYLGECIRMRWPKLVWGYQTTERKVDTFQSPCLLGPEGKSWFTFVQEGQWCAEAALRGRFDHYGHTYKEVVELVRKRGYPNVWRRSGHDWREDPC